jgi:hypothetical protein
MVALNNKMYYIILVNNCQGAIHAFSQFSVGVQLVTFPAEKNHESSEIGRKSRKTGTASQSEAWQGDQ